MAEKAVVKDVSVFVWVPADSEYRMDLDTIITDGSTYHNMSVSARAGTFNPLTPVWRTRIKEAVIAEALASLDLVVDQVMFPDFGVLGV